MAKANSNGITYQEVIRAVQRKEYKPVYLLMGDESYYIDRISDYIADNVLTEEEKGFNLSVIYCTKETEVSTIINAAKRYPMMSRYQVVVVKEAQNLSKSEDLFYYVQKPLDSTILVICFKNGTIDRRKKLVPAIEKVGVVFESKKLKESQLGSFVTDYLRRKGVGIDELESSHYCYLAINTGSIKNDNVQINEDDIISKRIDEELIVESVKGGGNTNDISLNQKMSEAPLNNDMTQNGCQIA